MNVEEIMNSEEFQEAIDKLTCDIQTLIEVLARCCNDFISAFEQLACLLYNQWSALSPVADLCLIACCNPRVAHLARFSKKKRVRKKNINRIIKAY